MNRPCMGASPSSLYHSDFSLYCSQHKALVLFFIFALCVCVWGVALLHDFWDLSSLTKDWTWAHGSESAESQPLDCQGIPRTLVLLLLMYLFSVALSLRCCAQVFSS